MSLCVCWCVDGDHSYCNLTKSSIFFVLSLHQVVNAIMKRKDGDYQLSRLLLATLPAGSECAVDFFCFFPLHPHSF